MIFCKLFCLIPCHILQFPSLQEQFGPWIFQFSFHWLDWSKIHRHSSLGCFARVTAKDVEIIVIVRVSVCTGRERYLLPEKLRAASNHNWSNLCILHVELEAGVEGPYGPDRGSDIIVEGMIAVGNHKWVRIIIVASHMAHARSDAPLLRRNHNALGMQLETEMANMILSHRFAKVRKLLHLLLLVALCRIIIR